MCAPLGSQQPLRLLPVAVAAFCPQIASEDALGRVCGGVAFAATVTAAAYSVGIQRCLPKIHSPGNLCMLSTTVGRKRWCILFLCTDVCIRPLASWIAKRLANLFPKFRSVLLAAAPRGLRSLLIMTALLLEGGRERETDRERKRER